MKSSMRLRLAFVLVIMILVAACSNSALKATAKALNDSALAIGTLQNIVILANAQGAISRDDTAAIFDVCGKINSAGLQVEKVTKNYTTLPAGQNLTALLTPLISAVQDSINSAAVVNIKDPKVKADVLLSLGIVQTALASAQSVLGGK